MNKKKIVCRSRTYANNNTTLLSYFNVSKFHTHVVVKEVYMKKTEREQNWIETKLESKGKETVHEKERSCTVCSGSRCIVKARSNLACIVNHDEARGKVASISAAAVMRLCHHY